MDDHELDRVLGALPAEQPTADLRFRVLAAAPRARAGARRWWWTVGAGWAAAAAAGVLIGFWSPSDPLVELDQALETADASLLETAS